MAGRKATEFETALRLERLTGFRERLAKHFADVRRQEEMAMELAFARHISSIRSGRFVQQTNNAAPHPFDLRRGA